MSTTFSEKVTKFVPILDEVYKKEATTSILETDGVQFSGTKKVKVPMIEIDGAADYDRSGGYVDGTVAVEYQDYELEYDRGRKFRIDVMDDDESAFDLYRTASLEYVRMKEIPETDAIRFAKIASSANKSGVVEMDTFTDALKVYDEAEEYLTDNEVPEGDRVIFVSTAFYKALKQQMKEAGRLDATKNADLKTKILTLDDMPLRKVPKGRFYNTIQLLDGKSTDQATGGYKPIVGTSKQLHLIYGAKSAMRAITKRKNSKVFMPSENQSADAYDVFYRMYHDLIVMKNKSNGIYVVQSATAAVKAPTPPVSPETGEDNG